MEYFERSCTVLIGKALILACSAQQMIVIPKIGSCPLPDGMFVERVVSHCPEHVGWRLLRKPFRIEPLFLDSTRSGGQAKILEAIGSACPEADGGIPLAIKLNRLELEERTMGSDTVTALNMNMDILVSEKGGYRLALNVGLHLPSPLGIMPISHSESIRMALELCLGEFNRARSQGVGDSLWVPESWLGTASRNTGMDLPVMRTAALPKGVIASFTDFRYANVLPVGEMDISVSKYDEVQLRGKATAASTAWGLSDGVRCFVRVGRDFVAMERDSLGFVVTIPVDASGAGIRLALNLISLPLGAFIYPAGYSSFVQSRLDLATGDWLPTQAHFRDAAPAQGMHWLHHSRFSKSDDTLFVLHRGQLFALERGSYCVIPCVVDGGTEIAQLSSTSGTSTIELDCSTIGVKVHLIEVKEGAAPMEKRMTAQMEVSAMQRLLPEQRRACVQP